MTPQPSPVSAVASAADVAGGILAMADRDVAFVITLRGDSLQLLVDHFMRFIEVRLAARDVTYGDHPLLRPFIESHARELVDFVQAGIGLQHQFGLRALEQSDGDHLRLFRVDLWDSLRSHIEHAEHHFTAAPNGLAAMVAEVAAFRAEPQGGSPR